MALSARPNSAIGAFSIPRGAVWSNRQQQPQVDQQVLFALSGNLHVRESVVSIGQTITISIQRPDCYLTAAQLASLRALEASAATQHAFTWGDYNGLSWAAAVSCNVIFDRRNGPGVDFDPGDVQYVFTESGKTLVHTGTINLIRVS